MVTGVKGQNCDIYISSKTLVLNGWLISTHHLDNLLSLISDSAAQLVVCITGRRKVFTCPYPHKVPVCTSRDQSPATTGLSLTVLNLERRTWTSAEVAFLSWTTCPTTPSLRVVACGVGAGSGCLGEGLEAAVWVKGWRLNISCLLAGDEGIIRGGDAEGSTASSYTRRF